MQGGTMSIWRELKDDDIDFDFEQNQVEILASEDHNGNNYVTLTFDQIRAMWQTVLEDGENYTLKDL